MKAAPMEKQRQLEIADAVRQACLQAARRAYEDGGISGLCADGRWEYVLDVLANLDLEAVLDDADRHENVQGR
jgi:hypothetical protein